jgi:hypothetical protein
MVLMKTRKNNTICKIFDIEKLNEEQSIHFNNFINQVVLITKRMLCI